MKFNTPLPQPLPKECEKAAKIFNSFVDNGNNGLDGVIPRQVLENAKGFAIFTIVKAGFLFSARAGSGVVIAKLDDGTWSAPSAIGTAGLGVGGQAGAEMTDFLIVLNSRSAVRSFMAAGSLTLGGNMSLALGPLGRNGEASGSLNTSGKVAAMYSYSKTRGLFGGVSIEGSVIVERQDANAIAYNSSVTAKQLLSGSIDVPDFALPLIRTLEACVGMPGGRKWVEDNAPVRPSPYLFGRGVGSPGSTSGRTSPAAETAAGTAALKKKRNHSISSFPPASWGTKKDDGSYFSNGLGSSLGGSRVGDDATSGFATHFESDFVPETQPAQFSQKRSISPSNHESSFSSFRSYDTASSRNEGLASQTHSRSISDVDYRSKTRTNPFSKSISDLDPFSNADDVSGLRDSSSTALEKPYIAQKAGLVTPLSPLDGVGRAIALYDFNAVEPGDLSFKKGQVITVTNKTDETNDWWTGKLDGREGIFPANFVELV